MFGEVPDYCPICHSDLPKSKFNQGDEGFSVNCPSCGHFIVTEEAWDDGYLHSHDNRWNAERRAALSFAIRTEAFPNRLPRSPNLPFLSRQTLDAFLLQCPALPMPSEREQSIVEYTGDFENETGQSGTLSDNDYPLFGFLNSDQMEGILSHLKKEKRLIDFTYHTTDPFVQNLKLTGLGWEKWEFIKRSKWPTNILNKNSYEYDVFISHASEDKESFVGPLANKLSNSGLKVWYDEFTLKWGDSLRQEIDKGLSQSKLGLVVLSKNFFKKKWTNRELDGLISNETAGVGRVLPVWHEVSKEEVRQYSPLLADKLAKSSHSDSIQDISDEIKNLLG